MRTQQQFLFQAQLIMGLLFIALLLPVLILNHGTFIFPLDDPYIHLAMAENILQGHFGVNLGEYSAPSSSILWPFLIAPLTLLPGTSWIILLLNLVFACLTLYLVCLLIQEWFGDKLQHKWTFVVLVIICFNLLGLVFIGMEHSLQVLLSTMVFYGYYKTENEGRLSWVLLTALALGPLVRYENAVFSAVFGGYLFFRQYRLPIFVAGVLALGGLILYSYSLHRMGLGWLPSSIMEKSNPVAERGTLSSLLINLVRNMVSLGGPQLVFLWVALLVAGVRRSAVLTKRIAYLSVCALSLHLVFGRMGWFSRYEIYVALPSMLAVVFCYQERFLSFFSKPWKHILLCLLLLMYLVVYGKTTLYIPWGSNNIYDQQYQMHRFVTEIYKQPVAVNDLGWVSYQNDEYVLDLWGLASHEALLMRKSATDAGWMEQLVNEHHVGLAMIYVKKNWFKSLPKSWCHLGTLSVDEPIVSLGSKYVYFFMTPNGNLADITTKLEQFQRILPAGVTFSFDAPKDGVEGMDGVGACSATK